MNHPHESQAAAMARAGELTDGEQLRESVNSGQVSAAQVVAHAENGEVTTGWPPGMLQDDSRGLSKALSRDPNARALVREAVAEKLPVVGALWEYIGKDPMTHQFKPCARALHEMNPDTPPYPDTWRPIDKLVKLSDAQAAIAAGRKAS